MKWYGRFSFVFMNNRVCYHGEVRIHKFFFSLSMFFFCISLSYNFLLLARTHWLHEKNFISFFLPLPLSLSLVFFILFIRYSALFFFSHWILLALCFDWFLLQTFSDAKTIYRYLVILLSSRYMWILFTIHTDI